MRGIIVLMYHALYSGMAELEAIPPEERPYAVSVDDFSRQVDLLLGADIPVLDPQAILGTKSDKGLPGQGVLLTFDDGHDSFYRHVLPLLVSRGLSGIFFVSSGLIETRSDFCTWDQLTEMSRAGMWVQSHGETHRFLTNLDDRESSRELAESKAVIEKHVGRSVTAVSFPGGRFGEREIGAGKKLSYRWFFTSRPGINGSLDLALPGLVKRMAVRQGTTDKEFMAMATGDRWNMTASRIIYSVKAVVRKLFGDRLYHLLYRLRG